jgi:hypothetical protein
MDRISLIVVSSVKIEKKKRKKSYHNQALRNVERRRTAWVDSYCVSGADITQSKEGGNKIEERRREQRR